MVRDGWYGYQAFAHAYNFTMTGIHKERPMCMHSFMNMTKGKSMFICFCVDMHTHTGCFLCTLSFMGPEFPSELTVCSTGETAAEYYGLCKYCPMKIKTAKSHKKQWIPTSSYSILSLFQNQTWHEYSYFLGWPPGVRQPTKFASTQHLNAKSYLKGSNN